MLTHSPTQTKPLKTLGQTHFRSLFSHILYPPQCWKVRVLTSPLTSPPGGGFGNVRRAVASSASKLFRMEIPNAEPPAPPTAPPAQTPAAPPAPPPAARIVVEAQPSERELSLAAELATERSRSENIASEKRLVERSAAELEDENFRLRKAQQAPPRKKSGWTTIINVED